MTAPHLPAGVPLPPVPRGVAPIDLDLGSVAGQRVRLLSLEAWEAWADLRFARIDVGATQRLTRRVPPAAAWSVLADGAALEILDAVGRGDRSFSNGEVRLRPTPRPGATLDVTVEVVPGQQPLTGTFALPPLDATHRSDEVANRAVERFLMRAGALGVDVEVSEFPEGTRTAADAAAAIGCHIGQIVKSLVFLADGAPVLVLTSGANRVDETRLAVVLGASRIAKADADAVRTATGFAIGGTPPFGHDTDVAIVCDRDLTTFDEIWAAAGTPTTVFALAPAILVEVTGALVADIAA